MLPFESDYLRLSYRPDLHLLLMRWTRPATSAEHRAGYRAALVLGKQQQASHWLVDLRSRGLADLTDLDWVLQEFAAEARATFAIPDRRIAYFTTPYYADILRPRLLQHPHFQSSGLQIEVFTEEMPAYHWLQTGQ
ncbi:hypothetical protein K3G63_15530 [Hymenobacter sp. HSC-4F20]|uniref:hypothetical protein n=1 Tax=Hymenobacter sp. HSC-4F20 TaxID=2864135 RepID=UPI001C733AB0|nr:hypothetical protein [Hymenobacter sp. HSC-4F20]MBX0291863.1 hypothetical protein [Hymenobacter sp. HSC-4F20]